MLPNPLPRPEGERERLEAAWRPPTGVRLLTVVNNTYIGLFYLGTAFGFFLLAGVLALVMRTQLALPENDLLGPDRYNQLFTMHGTVMMFLFAVPAVEAMGVYLLPNMLGARDLPFPRLGAYAFWAYAVGGVAFFSTLFFGVAPDGGWFMYPPLTSAAYSPGKGTDFWLLGIGFIEISAIAGAIEVVVGVLRTRAPGMTLARMPVYAWAMLALAGMIVLGFPAVILATALLELERALDWPFFIAERGGDPLLWQHLFWYFGHPEVYIIFLPAAGFVSMILPAMVRTPLVAYRLVVLGMIATALLSLGVWAHHMFTTGIPRLAVSFFSAASLAVAVPSGIQVFAWIATIADGRLRLTVPALFVLGFLVIFTLGGLTGVMLGLVPFDWQMHDTYFVVAHLHYVLIGGMLFPFFGALYYWIPSVSVQALSERVGRWVFALMFVGFNLAFFPMHIAGLLGMPRRVWTYPAGLGWEPLNLTATIGAYLLGAGVLLFVFDLVQRFRSDVRGGHAAGNVWGAGTLEWLPNAVYGHRSIPIITSREPLWEQPDLEHDVEAGGYYLPDAPTGARETIVTSARDAEPQYVLELPGPGWSPMLAGWFTAFFFLALTLEWLTISAACGVVALAMMWVWMWRADREPTRERAEIGGGLTLPVSAAGASSHSGLATLVLIAVAAALLGSLVFSYFFLWMGAPEMWPARTRQHLPDLSWAAGSVALLLASSVAIGLGGRALAGSRIGAVRLALGIALVSLVAALACDLLAQWRVGLRPTQNAYGAIVYAAISLQGVYVVVLAVLAAFVLARSLARGLGARRRATWDNTAMLWHYTAAQGVFIAALVHLVPRWLS